MTGLRLFIAGKRPPRGAPASERSVCSRPNAPRSLRCPFFVVICSMNTGTSCFRQFGAETVTVAIRQAFEILESNDLSNLPHRQVYAFDVWNDDARVFPELPPTPTKFEELRRRSVSLSASAKALGNSAARERTAILKQMSRTSKAAADEYRKQADAVRRRQGAR